MSGAQRNAEDDEHQPDPRRWKALMVTLAAGFMSLLDVSIVNVALPSIQKGLGASPQGVQWVVSGYALTFGLSLVAGGRLGDAFGRRRMFAIALVAFVLTSAAAGAAPTELLMISARLLQGLAAGLLTPQNSGLIQDMFRGAERGKAFGLFGATIGISTAAGPVLGGLILALFGEESGWRWVFYVNVPIGVLALVFALRLVPGAEERPADRRTDIDYVGALLLGLTVTGVLLPLVEAESGGNPLLWLLVVVSAGLGWAFVRWERRVAARERTPLLDIGLFSRAAGYRSGIALGTVYFSGFSGIWLVLSMFFQQGLGYTPLESGLSVTSFAIGSAATAVIAGRLVSRYGRRLTVFGLSVLAVALIAVALIVPHGAPSEIGWLIAGPLLLGGVGGGSVVSPNTTLTLEDVPTEMAGAAGGALQTGQRIGTAIGTAVLASAFRLTVRGTGHYPTAASVAMFCATALILVALVIAVYELRRRAGRTGRPQDTPQRRHLASSCDLQRT